MHIIIKEREKKYKLNSHWWINIVMFKIIKAYYILNVFVTMSCMYWYLGYYDLITILICVFDDKHVILSQYMSWLDLIYVWVFDMTATCVY